MGLFSFKKKEKEKILEREEKIESMASLTIEDVFVNLESCTKQEAIRLAGKLLVEKDCVEKEYVEGMIKREEIATTYLGSGVAIPHGTGELKKHIKKTGLVVLQFPQGVDFDGELAFLIVGIAGLGNDHLPILQTVASIMLEDDILESILHSTDKEFIYKTLIKGV